MTDPQPSYTFKTLSRTKSTDKYIKEAREDVKLIESLLDTKDIVYQVDGWTPPKEDDTLSSVLRQLSTSRQVRRLSSSIGIKFPPSRKLPPFLPTQLLKKLKDSSFVAKGGGGIVFRRTIGTKQQIYKIVILNDSFLSIKTDWDSVFHDEIIPAHHASNLYGPKIDWHCIYYNKKQFNKNHERIDKAIGVIAMESFDGDLYSLIKKTLLKHRYDILTTCFNQIKGLLDKQLASPFDHTHYFCHDIRDANILYRKKQSGGAKKTKSKKKLTSAKKHRTHRQTPKAQPITIRQSAPSRPTEYTFILSDFDHSHCNQISKTEYRDHRDALQILLYCRISLHFSELVLQKPITEFIDYLREDQNHIIGYAVISDLFQNKSRELKKFFSSDLWKHTIAPDFHFYTPFHIEGWGLEEPDVEEKISSLLIELYQQQSINLSEIDIIGI